MQNIKLEYFLPEHFEEFRENILKSGISDKLTNKNPLKNFMFKLEHKRTNGITYKFFCLLFLCYALIIQLKAFYQNNQSVIGMMFLTLFFLLYILICWKKPILQIRGLAFVLSPVLIIKMMKQQYSVECRLYKWKITKVIFKKIFMIFCLVGGVLLSFEVGKAYSDFNYVGNFTQNFFNDIFRLNSILSPNIFINYFFFITASSIILSVFSNPFYTYERILIRKKIERDGWFNIIFTILSGFIMLFILNIQYPNYLKYSLKNLSELYLAAIIGVTYLIFFTLVYVLFYSIRKLSLTFEHN